MSEACQKILRQIDDCETVRELLRIDNSIPDALLTNAEQLICDRAVEQKLSKLNHGGKLK